ncbi:FecR domain-containing protein [Bdellovibrio sp. HCB-162]|uniref:FecR family protein n=1 Tax=Bdellovibrio sp. HCB-162 TaxID=3394234 RepID=UPI0039BCF557
MKKQYLSWCVLGLSLFLYQTSAFAEQMYGVFMVTKGSVKVQNAKAGTSDAKVGVKVYEGDTVITAADSRAKIVMSDRNVINVNPETKIQIAKYENDAASGKKNVELNLLEGKVRNNVEQTYDGEKSKFLIKTPTAVAGVRGTQFLAGYNPSTQMTSIVTFKGAVTLASVNSRGQIVGSAVVVRKGEATSAAPNAAPEAPKSMSKEELKKMDADTASVSKGDANREIASGVGAPSLVTAGDTSVNNAPEAPPQLIPTTRPNVVTGPTPPPQRFEPKTKVIVRPQPVGN